jgi:hypothetical protein
MMELQERPEYQLGWNERTKGTPRQDIAFLHDLTNGPEYEALKLGWDQCDEEHQPRPGEP